MEIIDNFCELG